MKNFRKYSFKENRKQKHRFINNVRKICDFTNIKIHSNTEI